jgi:hypothetical protein
MSPLSTLPENYINLTGDLVGTGPFVYDEYIENVEVNFHAYENYWAGAAQIDVLKFIIISDLTARTTALIAGEIDFTSTPDSAMLQFPSEDITLVDAGNNLIIAWIAFNYLKINLSMRKAISWCLNYSYIIDVVTNGLSLRLPTYIPFGIPYANYSLNAPQLNRAKARDFLLNDSYYGPICADRGLNAGSTNLDWINVANNNPIEQYNYTWNTESVRRRDIGLRLAFDMEYIGCNLTLIGVSWSEFLDFLVVDRHKLDMFTLGWGPDYIAPEVYINQIYSNTSIINGGNFYEPDVQALMEEGLIEMNPLARKAIYDEIQRLMVEVYYPAIPLYTGRNFDAYNSKFNGFQSNPLDRVWFYSAYYKQDIEPPIMYVVSSYLIHDVILDGEISSSDEWDDTASYIIPLDRAWGWPDKQVDPRVKSMTARFKNDDEWLYILYQIPWSAADTDIYDNGNIELFSGPYGPPWAESDYSGLAFGNYSVDLYGWNESSWTWDTEINVEGNSSHDGEYYWFEFRKKLDSGDGQDWSLEPGDLVGNPNAAIVDNLLVGFWDNSGPAHYEQRINLLLGTTPKIKSNWLVNEVDPDGVVSPGEWDDAIAYNIDLNRTWWIPERQSVPSGKVLTARFKNDEEWLYGLYEIPISGLSLERAGFAHIYDISDNGWVKLNGGSADEYWGGTSWVTDAQNDMQGTGSTDSLYYRFEFRKRLDSGDGQDWVVWPGEVVGSPNAPAGYPHFNVHLWDNVTFSSYEQHISLQLSKPQVKSNWSTNNVDLDGLITYSEEWAEAKAYDLKLYNESGWPTPIYLRSDKNITVRFKNDGEWLYILYEIPWSNPLIQPESAGISYTFFSGVPQTDVDSGWVNLAGGTVDYYGWNGTTFFNDELVSGQNDVEGAATFDSENDLYRFEFRKRLNSGDGWDWSVTPGETMGDWNNVVEVEVWDYETGSTVSQFISIELMRSETIHVTSNFNLTTDMYFESGDGIVIDADDIIINGNGHKIVGNGTGTGILNYHHDNVTINNITIMDFEAGISIYDGQENNISVNYICDNLVGINISATHNNVTNNIIARNNLGVILSDHSNYVYRNLLINNIQQISNVSGNIWVDPINNVGNFWSNYWGNDTNSDDIGDTQLPHEGVDYRPLMDPSIPEVYGPLPYADWWMWGRGGSTVIIKGYDPYGREISKDVNEIGLNAFYIENDDVDPGEERIIILMAINPVEPLFGNYTFEITAGSIFSWTQRLSVAGDVPWTRSVKDEYIPDDALYTSISEVVELEDPETEESYVTALPGDVTVVELEGPSIYISQPDISEHIYTTNVEVVGIATDDTGIYSITVNGVEIYTLTGDPETEVSFSTTVELAAGEDVITIIVTDTDEEPKSTMLERTVIRPDGTPPVVNSEIVPLSFDGEIAKFRVLYSATDEIDPDPTVTPLLKLSLPEDISRWKVRFRVGSNLKFKFDYEVRKLVIIAPNPQEIWEQIEELGGVLVEDEQVIRVIIKSMDELYFEILLEITAMDASGNIGTAFDTLILDDDS